jgi:hypothetical protein
MTEFNVGDRVRVLVLPSTFPHGGRVGAVCQVTLDGAAVLSYTVCFDGDTAGVAPAGFVTFWPGELEAAPPWEHWQRLAATGGHQEQRPWSQRDVGPIGRVVGAVGLVVIFLVSAGLVGGAIFALVSGAIRAPQQGEVTSFVLFFAGLMLASGWMLLRLVRGTRQTGGPLMMPKWFYPSLWLRYVALLVVVVASTVGWLSAIQAAAVMIGMVLGAWLLGRLEANRRRN